MANRGIRDLAIEGKMKWVHLNPGLVHKLIHQSVEIQRELDMVVQGAKLCGLSDKFAVAWVYEKERAKSDRRPCLRPNEVLMTLRRALDENRSEALTANDLRAMVEEDDRR